MSFAQAQISKGLRKQQRGDIAGAVGHYRAVLSRSPRNAHALYFYALACQQLKRYDEAIRAMHGVLQLVPTHADAWYNLARFLQDTRQSESALHHYIAALEHDPNHIEALVNAGNLYLEFGESKLAELCYHHALAQDPTRPEAEYNRAFVKLAQGDQSGWQDYEARWRCAGHIAEHWREFMDTTPRWDGSPIPGKTLLLHWEQGFGDTIHFVRYARTAAQQAQASVILEVQQPLYRLMAESFLEFPVYAHGEEVPPFDYYASLMSLPALCGGLGDEAPYLRAQFQAKWVWKAGICWAGSKGHLNDHNRSVSLNAIRPIVAEHAHRFVSLQVGDRADEADALGISRIHPGDFAETARLIKTLDLVITVDTSVAHLAGALNVPTWLMLPTHPDFRWTNEGTTTPLYPAMTLYRQTTRGDWASVIQRIASDLRARIA